MYILLLYLYKKNNIAIYSLVKITKKNKIILIYIKKNFFRRKEIKIFSSN